MINLTMRPDQFDDYAPTVYEFELDDIDITILFDNLIEEDGFDAALDVDYNGNYTIWVDENLSHTQTINTIKWAIDKLMIYK